MAHSYHGNTVPSGQQKQRNAPAGHVVKVVDAVQYGLCTLGFFQIEFTSRRRFDIGNDIEIFYSNYREIVYI